ncbi:MAG TPA: SDR family oxidoreductase [Opitutales bacterium]|nr:SDR family oxidoreductase [Opitutales bacterium]
MKTILITGSNRGIGLALTAEFLQQGDRVIATARQPDEATELQALAAKYPSTLQIERMDVADQAAVDQLASKLSAEGNPLDVLINNAGIISEADDDSLEKLKLDHLERAFAINVVAVARVSQAFLPVLKKSERARIVNISSGAGSISDKTDSRNLSYSVSKAALNQLTRGMAADLRENQIIVVPITPGWVKTEMGGTHADLTPADAAKSLVSTIKKLNMKQTGTFLDRHGRSGVYNW